MTRNYLAKPVQSDMDFDEALSELLQTAHENAVDIEGGWVCRNGVTMPDWDITIVELAKPGSP